MALKPQSDKAPAPLPDSPTWGELADPGQPVSVVRFECGDTVYSYPYHTLARWALKHGDPDELSIQAGTDQVIVRGRALTPVQDALDSARLRILRQPHARYGLISEGTVIINITVQGDSGDD